MDENTKEAFKQFYKYQIKIFELNCESLEWQHKMQAHLRGFADGLGFEHDANTQTPYLKNFEHDENTQAKYVKRLELAQSLRELKAHGFVCSDDRQFFLANDAYRKVLEQNNEIAQATHGSTRNTAADATHGSTQKKAIVLDPLKIDNKDMSEVSAGGEADMKYITKRKDGRWQGRRTIKDKRICVYGTTQKECCQNLKIAMVAKPEQKLDSFYDFAMHWLTVYKKDVLTANIFRDYVYVIGKHLKITTPINLITVDQLQRLINTLPATRIREKVFQIIKQIFKKAYELDKIVKDISKFVCLGKIQRKQVEAILPEQQQQLFDALTNDDFSMRVLFYIVTGARPSEIATVNPNEIQDGYILLHGSKTKNAVRWVKVSKTISDIFKSKPASFFKFDNKRFRERLQRLYSTVNIKDGTVYTLRHTFATNLYIIGVAEKDRQTYMGHASGSQMTNDVYTTFCPNVTKKDIYDIYGDFYPQF